MAFLKVFIKLVLNLLVVSNLSQHFWNSNSRFWEWGNKTQRIFLKWNAGAYVSHLLLSLLCILIEIFSILGNVLYLKQGFVLAVTVLREAVDEFRRYKRDKEMNSQLYSKLTIRGWHFSPFESCTSFLSASLS